MLGPGILSLFVDVDDHRALPAHRRQHPDDVVGMGVDRFGEVEAATAALRPGDDEQVGEPVAV